MRNLLLSLTHLTLPLLITFILGGCSTTVKQSSSLEEYEQPESIIVPVSSLGEVSETRKQILQNTLTEKVKEHFRIVSQEKYEQVLEKIN